MRLKNKNVLVYGLGVSGKGAIKLLKRLKSKVFVYDDNNSALNSLCDDKVYLVNKISEEFIKTLDLIVVNPSVSKYCENLILAFENNIKIISEIELAYRFCKGKIISVTGSNGKSTTCSLIYSILSGLKKKSSLVGNIGYSFCESVNKDPKQTFVVEVSSFQLETIDKYKSNIACFTNFTENHLDRHFSIKEYFETKCKIFNNQKNSDYRILNFDDNKVKTLKFKKTYFFSRKTKVKGTFVKDDYIYFNNGKKEEKILPLSLIKLIGEHNLENVLCAVLVCKLMKVPNNIIQLGVERFMGLNHRIEFVKELNGISFYNDSKSTTVKATLTALSCFNNHRVLLILGGSDKGFDFLPLFQDLPTCVKKIIAIGEVKDKILKDAQNVNFENVISCDDFEDMVKCAYEYSMSENLDTVLLSPATASFDMFKNFEDRGDVFKGLVEKLI